jgi:hypothetical protein
VVERSHTRLFAEVAANLDNVSLGVTVAHLCNVGA